MSQKRLRALVGAVAIFASACGGTTATQPPASVAPGESPAESTGPSAGLAAEQVLRLSLGSEDPQSLDPTKGETSTDIAVLHGLNRSLLYFDKELNVVPELAEAMPEVSADGRTYTFTLRDAKYSNGDPIVAADLVYAWKRLIDPRTGAYYQFIISDVEGGADILALKADAADSDIQAAVDKFGVSAPDDKTFVVKLANPVSYFLYLATLWNTGPIPEKWITSPNATEAENYVSSGPFKMKSWSHQAELVIEPNPNWYGTKPTLTEIRWKIGGDPAADQASFEAGELDMLAASPPDVPRITADPELGPLVVKQTTSVLDYWGFDTTKGPTGNRAFRRALSMAIDKETMMATVYGGQGVVAGSVMPPGMKGHQPELGLKYDVEAAKAELATALSELGVADASAIPPLSFGFNTNAGHEETSAFMQEQWRTNLGIESELKGTTFDTFVVERPALKYSIARNAWGADYPHPDTMLRILFHSESGNNDEGYSNPEYDRLIDEASQELDEAKSLELYGQAQAILVEDAPAVFTRWRVSNYEVRPWVTGYSPTPLDSNVIGDYWYEDIQILEH